MDASPSRLRSRLSSLWPPSPASLRAPARLELGGGASLSAAFVPGVTALLAVWALYAWDHQFLCDDAFISFRYAENLWRGDGLVWNRGERVEGYTNFAWVLELAAVKALFGLSPERASLGLSVACTLGTFAFSARLARTTPFAPKAELAVLLTLALLVVNRNVAVWTTGGLETRQMTFLVVLAVLLLQRTGEGFLRYVPASFAFGGVELTRPEGHLLFGCAAVWLALRAVMERRLRRDEWLGFLLPYLVIAGAHTGFRLAYYGELVPNTYHAKAVRPWLEGGRAYLTVAVVESGLYLAWPLALVGLVARWRRRRDSLHVLSCFLIAPHTLYLVYIGGDHFEFRPFDFHWPLLALASADGLLALGAAAERLARPVAAAHAPWVGRAALGVATAALIAYSTVLQLAQHLPTRMLRSRWQTRALLTKLERARFAPAFALPGIEQLAGPYNAALEYTTRHSIGLRWAEHRGFHESQLGGYGAYLPHVERLIPDGAVMPNGTIGVLGYVLRTLTIVDTHGLTDRTVARNPVTVPNRARQLAHDRFPPPGYLARRGVNIDVHPVARSVRAETPFALRLPDGRFMPFASRDPAWVLRAFEGRGLWWRKLSARLHDNQVMVEGQRLEPVRALGFFDNGHRDGWRAEGDALRAPVARGPARQQKVTGHLGAGFVDSFTAAEGDRATGSLSSPVFVPERGELLVFLVGGGGGSKVGVELRVEDRVVETHRGEDAESLGLVAIDLRPYAGKVCRVRVFDHSRGAWGHVLADHFLLAREPEADLR